MTVEELSANQQIRDTLSRYCRSLDRMDTGLYDTVFVTGAALDYGAHFTGSAEEFRDWVWQAHTGMQAHSHQITNVLAEIDAAAGAAVSEAYVTVCLRTVPDAEGRVVDIVDRGRYLDRWTRDEDGRWRIAARRFRSDIQQVLDGSGSPAPDVARDRTDPSYELFA